MYIRLTLPNEFWIARSYMSSRISCLNYEQFEEKFSHYKPF